MDFYRIDDPLEVIDLGLDEYFSSNSVCVIEWADKYQHLLPTDNLSIDIQISDKNKRIINLSATGTRYTELIESL